MKTAIKLKPQTLPRPGDDSQTDGNVLGQLAALQNLSVKDLKDKWQVLFSLPAPNNSRPYLELRLGYRIQELTYGGVSRDTRMALDCLADEVEGKVGRRPMTNDPRNPIAGTKLLREWNGVEHTVTVLGDGYDWQGRRYRSLSAVAKAITGTTWNGFRFFGFRDLARSSK